MMRTKIIDRFVLKGFFASWISAVIFFQGMYLVVHFFSRMDRLSGSAKQFKAAGIDPFVGFCRYYAINLPFIMVETAPFTILMGGMWILQQMARRGELVPILTTGISFRRLCMPLLATSLILGLGFAVLRDTVLPGLSHDRERMERLIAGKPAHVMTQIPLLRDSSGQRINIESYDVQNHIARGFAIWDQNAPKNEVRSCAALRYLEDGPGGPGWYPLEGARIDGPLSVPVHSDLSWHDIELEASNLLYLPTRDLRRMIARNPKLPKLRLRFHANLAYPLYGLILLFYGLPLILRRAGESAYGAVGLSLLISIAFFAAQKILADIGARGDIPPILGAWLPVVFFGLVGLAAFELNT